MNNIIGDNIKKYRKLKGITQEEFASLIGVTFQAVSKWERAESYPDINYLPSISKILHISIDELLGNNIPNTDNDIEHYLRIYNEYTFEDKNKIYLEFKKAAKSYQNDFRIQVRYMDLINKTDALITSEEYINKDFERFDKESKRIKHLYHYINDNCTDDSIRLWAKRIMCEHLMYIYDCHGLYKENLGEFEQILNTLPSLYETREYVSLMERDITKWFTIRENILNELIFLLSKVLVEYCYYVDENFSVDFRIEIIEEMNLLLESFSKQFDIDKNSVQYIYNLGHLAKLNYYNNNPANALKYIEKLVHESINFDKKENAKQLLIHYEKDNTMSMCERIKLLLLEYYGFSDEFKNDKKFIKLINKL